MARSWGRPERHKAQDWVEDLVQTGRDRTGALISTVRRQIRMPVKGHGFTSADGLAEESNDTLSRPPAAPKATGHSAMKARAPMTATKKMTARKVPTKSTAVRNAPA